MHHKMKIIKNIVNLLKLFSAVFATVTQSMVCPNFVCESERLKPFWTGDGNFGTLETIQNPVLLSNAKTPEISENW